MKKKIEDSFRCWNFGGMHYKRGLKVSRSKTEYMQAGVDDGGELRLQGEMVKKVEIFKYLWSVVSRDGSCEEEIRRRIQAGWLSWRKISGILYDRKLLARVKGKMYKCVVRPAIMYRTETVVTDK